MAADVTIRPASEADVPAMRAIYRRAVKQLGPVAYTPEQVETWASFADSPVFTRRLAPLATTLVAEKAGRVAGYASVRDNRVSALYVDPDFSRQGLATALLERLLATFPQRPLQTEASHFSRSVFERQGFELTEIDEVTRAGGVTFNRFIMSLHDSRG
ncbi:MAG: GNAT family N-acetyltransferase [Bacteroidota bacterium]